MSMGAGDVDVPRLPPPPPSMWMVSTMASRTSQTTLARWSVSMRGDTTMSANSEEGFSETRNDTESRADIRGGLETEVRAITFATGAILK